MSPRLFMTDRLPAKYGPVVSALGAPRYIVDTPHKLPLVPHDVQRSSRSPLLTSSWNAVPPAQKSNEPVVSPRKFVRNRGLAKLLQSTPLDSLWRRCQPGANH